MYNKATDKTIPYHTPMSILNQERKFLTIIKIILNLMTFKIDYDIYTEIKTRKPDSLEYP